MLLIQGLIVLSQRDAGGGAVRQAAPVLVLVGSAIVAVLVGGLVVMKLRERMKQARDQGGGADAGLLESLHSMRRSGAISDDEYQAMKSRVGRRVAAGLGLTSRAEGGAGGRPERKISGPGTNANQVLEAPPGFDLTGERLPDRSTPE